MRFLDKGIKEYVDLRIKSYDALEEDLTNIVKCYSNLPNVQSIVLYGSIARELNMKSTSDLDIMLIVDEFEDTRSVARCISKATFDLETSREIDTAFCATKTFYQKINECYYRNIIKEGVVLWQRS